MLPEAVRIVRITESIGRLEAGKLTPMVRAEFMVGEHGPFAEEFPRATFDPVAARTALEAFARKLEQLSQGR